MVGLVGDSGGDTDATACRLLAPIKPPPFFALVLALPFFTLRFFVPGTVADSSSSSFVAEVAAALVRPTREYSDEPLVLSLAVSGRLCLQWLNGIYNVNRVREMMSTPRGMSLDHTHGSASSQQKACNSMAPIERNLLSKNENRTA
jgi:hypothetical protein